MQMWTEDTAGGPALLVITPSVESLRGKTNKAAYFVQMTADVMFNSNFHGYLAGLWDGKFYYF